MNNELNELEKFNKKIKIDFMNDISKQEINKYKNIKSKFENKILETNAISNIIYFIFRKNINDIIRLLNIQNIHNTRIILTGQSIADFIYYYIYLQEVFDNKLDFSRMINTLHDNINDIDMFILAYNNELNDTSNTSTYDFEDNFYKILKESKISTNIYYQNFFTKLNFVHIENKLLSVNKNTSNNIKDFLYLSLLGQFDINSVQVGIVLDIKELKKIFQNKSDKEFLSIKVLYTRNYLEIFKEEENNKVSDLEIKKIKTNLNINKIENIKRFIKKSTRKFYDEKFDMLYPVKLFLILEEIGNIIIKNWLNYIDLYVVEEYLKIRNELVKLLFDNYKVFKEYFYIRIKDNIEEEEKKFIKFIEKYRFQNNISICYIPVEIKLHLNKENDKYKNKIKYFLHEFLEIKNNQEIDEVIYNYNFLDLANKILNLMEINNDNKMLKIKTALKEENLNYKLAFLNFIVYEKEILNEPLYKLVKFFKYIDNYYSTKFYNLLISNLPNKIELYNIILELDEYLLNEDKINNLLEFKKIKKFLNRENKEKIRKFIKTVLKFHVCSLEEYRTMLYLVYSIIHSNLKLNEKETSEALHSFIKEKYFKSYYQDICLNLTKKFYVPEENKLKNKNIIIKNKNFILKELTDNLCLEFFMQLNNEFYVNKEFLKNLDLFVFEVTLLNNKKKFLLTIPLNNKGKYVFEKDEMDFYSRIYMIEDYKLKHVPYDKLNPADKEELKKAIKVILDRLNNTYNILSI